MSEHTVSVVVDGVEIRGWTSYDLTSSMIEPVDSFRMELPFDRAAWDRLRPDRPVKVMIDGVVILDGFLDDREVPEADDVLQISGRDRCGRLLNESCPGVDFRGKDLRDLAAEIASPWFSTVTLSNTRNRRVLRGKGKKARAGREPLFVTTGGGTLVEPGQTRLAVLEELCQQAEVLVWSAGDGRELIIGRPNYDQEPQFRFFQPRADSKRAAEANVLGMAIKESTGDRYSEIIVVGTGGGTAVNYGAAVLQRSGTATTPTTDKGIARAAERRRMARSYGVASSTLGEFSAPKRLVIERAVSSSAEAQAYAEREMARRDAQGRRVTVRVPLHGQRIAGQSYTIFAPDLMASIEDERTGVAGAFLIVACTYRSSRDDGEETILEFVPKGQELAI